MGKSKAFANFCVALSVRVKMLFG